ncbi:MAG: histidine kinase [Cytophagales bacterium]|nr:histidine kinase [Cytophagales bacterium]
MKRLALFPLPLLCLLLAGLPLLAQDGAKKAESEQKEVSPKMRSLKSLRSKAADAASRVMHLLSLADEARTKEPNKALDYVAEALSLSISGNNLRGEAISYQTLGDINSDQALYGKAVENYRKALAVSTRLGDPDLAYPVKKRLADALEAAGDYPAALVQWDEVQQEATVFSRPEDVVRAKTAIARLHAKQGKEELALRGYQEVLKLEEKRGNDKGVIEANNNIGNLYLKQEKTKQALDYYEKSQNLAGAMADTLTLSRSNEMIGKVYRLEKRYDQELALRRQSIALHVKSNDRAALNDEYLEVARLFLEQQNAAAAIPYLRKSLALSGQLGRLDRQGEAYRHLSEAYGLTGDLRASLQHYKSYVGVMDTLYRRKEKELAGLLRFNEELAGRQKKIESLEKDRQLNAKTIELLRKEQKLKEERMNKQLVVIYGLGLGLAGVFAASYLLYQSARKRRIANQLLALKSLRSQMNPHFIFNALNSVNSFIAGNDERSANKYLSEFSRLMRAVMENSQHDLVPLSSELRILELYLGLEHFRFREKFDYSFTVDPAVDAESVQVPPMLIQPYVENAVWHGLRYKEEKGFLTVHVTQKADELVVTVEDNGIGRQQSQALKTANQKETVSTGLRNIENRLRIINDIHRTRLSVSIEDLHPPTRSGTRVSIHIPFALQAVPA